MNMRALLAVATVAAVLLAACNGMVGRGDGDDNRFSAFADIPESGWLYSEPVEFVPDTLRDSTVADGRLYVSVRHGQEYLYRNLWLEVSYADTDSSRRCDTLDIELADIAGRWTGRGMGLSMEVLDSVPGSYPLAVRRPLRVRHIMRIDTLAGIERIGVVYVPR